MEDPSVLKMIVDYPSDNDMRVTALRSEDGRSDARLTKAVLSNLTTDLSGVQRPERWG